MATMKLTRGTLTQRPNGWRWQYFQDGRRGSRTFTLPDGQRGKKAAWRHVDEVLRPQVAAGIPTEPERWTVREYLEEWLRLHGPTLRTQRSREAYAYGVRWALLPALGAIRVRELTSLDVAAWLNAWSEGHSPKSVAWALTLLKQALRWGCEQEPPLLLRNVAAGVRLTKRSAPEPDHYDSDEMLALIAALAPPYAAPAFLPALRGTQ